MKWLEALKIFNRDHKGTWCIPKKGTPEYKTVVDIMNGKHMRRQEIQGSGLIDVFGELYNKNKAFKEKKKARFDAFMKRADAIIAKQAEDAKKAEVASTPVVGSGKRKSMKGGRKGIGQLFREGLKKTVELKKLGELEQAKSVKQFQAKNAETSVVGSGKRRGRPKSN